MGNAQFGTHVTPSYSYCIVMMPASHYVSIMSCMSRGIFLKPSVHFFFNEKNLHFVSGKGKAREVKIKDFFISFNDHVVVIFCFQ